MKVISLDLEFNQPSQKIIQIGAVCGDAKSGAILDTFSVIVNPEEPLNPYIIALTGITEEQILREGVSLLDGYLLLKEFYNKNKPEIRNPITWGGGDPQELRKQLGMDEDNFIFGRRWIDTKTIFQAYRLSQDEKIQAGLAKAMTRVGLQFKGRKHNAKDDALNTLVLYSFLLKKFRK